VTKFPRLETGFQAIINCKRTPSDKSDKMTKFLGRKKKAPLAGRPRRQGLDEFVQRVHAPALCVLAWVHIEPKGGRDVRVSEDFRERPNVAA